MQNTRIFLNSHGGDRSVSTSAIMVRLMAFATETSMREILKRKLPSCESKLDGWSIHSRHGPAIDACPALPMDVCFVDNPATCDDRYVANSRRRVCDEAREEYNR